MRKRRKSDNFGVSGGLIFGQVDTRSVVRVLCCNPIYSLVVVMNNQQRPPFLPFHSTQRLSIHVYVDRKIFYRQRLVLMFGPDRMEEIIQSPLPMVIPIINYETSFDVSILILF